MTSGTSSCIRQKLVLSTTTAPAATNRGAHSALIAPPADERTRSSPWIDSSVSVRHSSSASPKATRLPAERSEANGTTSEAGKPALGEHLEQRRADRAGRADDADPCSGAPTLIDG